MSLRVWIVWSHNGKMRKRRLLTLGKSPVERRWEQQTAKAQRDFIAGIKGERR